MMNGASPLKHGLVDLSAILFVIGGVVSLVLSALSIPIANIYPVLMPETFSMIFLAVLGISLICSFGALHCYSLARKRMLSEAGIRGIIFGALLLIFSLGIGTLKESNTTISLATNTISLNALSAMLVLIAGVICFVLRHTSVSASFAPNQHMIAQPAYQA